MINQVRAKESDLVGLTFVLLKFESLTDTDVFTIKSLIEDALIIAKGNVMAIFFEEQLPVKDFVESIEQTLMVTVRKAQVDRFLSLSSFMFALENFNDLEDGFFKYGDVLELVKTIDEEYKHSVLKELYNDISVREFILIYVKCNMNVIKSSELLGLHRNTLNNKIRKIKEVTGFNPNNFEDLMILYLTIL